MACFDSVLGGFSVAGGVSVGYLFSCMFWFSVPSSCGMDGGSGVGAVVSSCKISCVLPRNGLRYFLFLIECRPE